MSIVLHLINRLILEHFRQKTHVKAIENQITSSQVQRKSLFPAIQQNFSVVEVVQNWKRMTDILEKTSTKTLIIQLQTQNMATQGG